MLSLVLVRHGETALNAERRYQGWIDPPLTSAGEAAARNLAPLLANAWAVAPATWQEPPTVFASDRVRALATAGLAVPGAPVSADPRLRELDFGAFDGHTWDENLARHGEGFRAWLADPDSAPPPGGERLAAFRDRVGAWLDDVARLRRVIAFAHAGAMHVILTRALDMPLAEARRLPIAPCDAIRLTLADGERTTWHRLASLAPPNDDHRTGEEDDPC